MTDEEFIHQTIGEAARRYGADPQALASILALRVQDGETVVVDSIVGCRKVSPRRDRIYVTLDDEIATLRQSHPEIFCGPAQSGGQRDATGRIQGFLPEDYAKLSASTRLCLARKAGIGTNQGRHKPRIRTLTAEEQQLPPHERLRLARRTGDDGRRPAA